MRAAALAVFKQFVGTQLKGMVPAEVLVETLNMLGKKFGHECAGPRST